jgi:hypothetical protein
MNYAVLQAEIQTDPAGKGYAAHLPSAPGIVVDLLNAQTETMAKPRYVTTRTIMAECAASSAILAALKAAAAENVEVECAWNFLNKDSGIDIGNERTLVMCDQLAAGGVLTQPQADQLKAMANQSASRAEVLGLGRVTEQDLIAAGVV